MVPPVILRKILANVANNFEKSAASAGLGTRYLEGGIGAADWLTT
jgi:hypothetical protein